MIDKLGSEVDMVARHLEILERVVRNQPIGIVKLSQTTEYQRHEVRYSLRMLEEEGIIEPSSQGAVTTDQVAGFLDRHRDRIDELIDRAGELSGEGPRTTPCTDRSTD